MKRLTFLLMILLIGLVSEAQPSIDKNWKTDTLYFEDFFSYQLSPWSNNNWTDSPNFGNWKSYLGTSVTNGSTERQVYRRENAIQDLGNGTMKLHAENAGQLIDTSEYDVPDDITKDPSATPIYYYSGAITTIPFHKYGYFEIRCKLPVNRGAFPAFWLWNDTGIYQEIDIFEYSWFISTNGGGTLGNSRYFEGRIYYGTSNNHPSYGLFGYQIPEQNPDLTNWHTYGLEWSPGRVLWYFDNKLVNSYTGDKVPNIDMYLMVNNAVSNDADSMGFPRRAGFPNDMIITHVKVNKLDCDCPADIPITNQTQFNTFDYKVYKTITIGGSGNNISIPSNSNVTFRATDAITISSDFSLPLGSSLNLITHPCPKEL